MENCVFKKVYLEDNTPIRIHIILVEHSLRLIVLRGENAWKSFVISENLNHFAIQHKLSLESYVEKLLEYVKNDNSEVAFTATDEEFVINRLLNKLKVKYFSCKLEKVNYYEYVEQIMDNFYSENVRFVDKLNATVREKNEIETYKINCELKLKELIEKKRTDEEELFGRFVLVLNEKKQRIQHLTELLEAFKAGRPTANPPVAVKGRKKATNDLPPKKLETISESESETSTNSDYNSEEEKPPPAEPSTSSTRAQTFDFLDDDLAPASALPKRAKHGDRSGVAVIPSTSKSPEREVGKNKEKKDSPTIDFNTQQLLDML